MVRHSRDWQQQQEIATILELEEHRKEAVFLNTGVVVTVYKLESLWPFPVGL